VSLKIPSIKYQAGDGMKKVMIVDDSLELGRLLKASLLVMDPTLKVVVVPSAEEAILESSRIPMDLLVTDIRLPGISGIDLVRKIRARRPVVKIMMITGLSDVHLIQQAKELAVDAFFRKPLQMPEFIEAARNCLGISSVAPDVTAQVESLSLAVPEDEVKHKKRREVKLSQEEELPDLLELIPAQAPAKTLPDILTDLRHSLGALAVLVVDERGHVLAEAGEPPDGGIIEKIISAWMAVHSPSLTLGALLKTGMPEVVQALRGDNFNILFAPLGMYSLGVVLPVGKSALRLALAFEAVLDQLVELADVLGADRIQPSSAMQPQLGVQDEQEAIPAFLEEEDVPEKEPAMGDFLSALEARPAAAADADTFWDTSGVPPAGNASPDMLSYDQALQLGLAPEDKE
jgi:DNA-binding response OmpR family regulator